MCQSGKCELGWTSRGSNLPLPARRPPAIASGHFYHFAILMDSIRCEPRPQPNQQRPPHHHRPPDPSVGYADEKLRIYHQVRHVYERVEVGVVAQSAQLLGLVVVSFAAFPNEITSHGGQIGRLAATGWSQLTSHRYLALAWSHWTKPPTTPSQMIGGWVNLILQGNWSKFTSHHYLAPATTNNNTTNHTGLPINQSPLLSACLPS